MNHEPLLTVSDLWVSYDRITAVRGVSFEVAAGEIVTLIGANGAGKSSILGAISGLLPVSKGRLTLAGRDLAASRPTAAPNRGWPMSPKAA
jgi:branched-chain amino acid transport system ATP-binding protein